MDLVGVSAWVWVYWCATQVPTKSFTRCPTTLGGAPHVGLNGTHCLQRASSFKKIFLVRQLLFTQTVSWCIDNYPENTGCVTSN